MSTLLYFHLKTSDLDRVAASLKTLTGIQHQIRGALPANFNDYILMNESADPNYLVIYPNNDWISVAINSFKKLHQWGEHLSAELQTAFVLTYAQTTSDAYYFYMYDKGQLQREIEVNYGDEENMVDFGKKLPFELRVIHRIADKEKDCVFFDLNTLERYCDELGFQLIPDDEGDSCVILKSDKIGLKTSNHYPRTVENRNRPWWKFW